MRRRSIGAISWYSLLPTMMLLAGQAFGADHFVPSSTSTVNCSTFNNGVKPGDTLTLAAGSRGPLTIRNCRGTSTAKIVVRNDVTGNGPTVIRRNSASSGGFVFTCLDCVQVVIDGMGKWNGAPQGAHCGAPSGKNGCGIRVTSVARNDSPTAYMKLSGMTTMVTVQGVEIDGRRSELNTTGIGISQNDHSIRTANLPNFWREDFVYENNYIHDVFGEGMYIGPNWREPDLGVPLRNITIRNNLVEDTGRQNIQLKSAIGGTNRIHHNVLRRSGLRGEAGQGTGISVFEGGHNARIYNNWIEASGAHGIQHYNMNIPLDFGPFSSEIYNNVIYDSGKRYGANSARSGIQVGSSASGARIIPKVYNNSIVKAADLGIKFNAQVRGGVARDNIVTDTASSALSLGDNKNVNNLVATASSIKFTDSSKLDFRLTADSPARDAGSATGFPTVDFPGLSRPQGAAADIGAFEFSTAAAPPKAPDVTYVK